MILITWTSLTLAALAPCLADDARERPVNWGTGSTDPADQVLEGVKTIALTNSDYFLDGGSLIYQAQTGNDWDLYIGLPHPAAVLSSARRKDHQYVIISRTKNFSRYAVVKKGSEAEKKLIDLLRRFAEKRGADEEPPRAPHGQDLIEAAQSIAITVQTRDQPKTWGAEALGMENDLFP
ncbi:MAG: hypothetical protein ACOCUY_03870 [Verrucomicrobiota bacterium]